MSKADIGLIGLAVMGQNLVLNMAYNGFSVGVYNRTASTTRDFMANQAAGKDIHPGYTYEEFVSQRERPRETDQQTLPT